MINYTSEQLNTLIATARQIKGQQSQDIATNAYLQSVLMDRIDNISQSDAADIIDRMDAAIREYNRNYNRGIEQGAVPAEDMLKDIISKNDYNDEQSAYFLASTIVTVNTYGQDITGLTEPEYRNRVNAVIGGREINDVTVQALIKEAAAAINGSDMIAFDEKTAGAIATQPLDASTIASIREMAESPLYTAVAAYIATIKGEMPVTDGEITPEGIATGVAAGTKVLELNADLAEGKISLPVWVRCIKVALGILLVLLATILTLAVIGLIIYGLATVGSEILNIFVGWQLGNNLGGIFLILKNYHSDIAKSYSERFDKTYAWIVSLIDKIKNRSAQIAETDTETVAETTVTSEQTTKSNPERPIVTA